MNKTCKVRAGDHQYELYLDYIVGMSCSSNVQYVIQTSSGKYESFFPTQHCIVGHQKMETYIHTLQWFWPVAYKRSHMLTSPGSRHLQLGAAWFLHYRKSLEPSESLNQPSDIQLQVALAGISLAKHSKTEDTQMKYTCNSPFCNGLLLPVVFKRSLHWPPLADQRWIKAESQGLDALFDNPDWMWTTIASTIQIYKIYLN